MGHLGNQEPRAKEPTGIRGSEAKSLGRFGRFLK
jgi:hypothetical protein